MGKFYGCGYKFQPGQNMGWWYCLLLWSCWNPGNMFHCGNRCHPWNCHTGMLEETYRFGMEHGRWKRDGWLWLVGLALDGFALKCFGQLLERLHVLVRNMGIWRSWCRVLDSIDEFGGGDCCIFCRGSERHCGIMWK